MAKSFIDSIYHTYIKPFRFLYGWAKDGATRAQSNARGAEWAAKGFQGAKLDICGGRYPYNRDEFLNVDAAPLPEVDVVFDIRKRFPMKDGVIAEILSVATLEHLRQHDVDHVLKESFRVLMPGAMIRVSTPDIEALAKGVLAHDDMHVLNQYLFGRFKDGETEDYDVHRWMYTVQQMMDVLKKTGFERIEQRPMEEVGLHDPRYNYLIRAFKPAR